MTVQLRPGDPPVIFPGLNTLPPVLRAAASAGDPLALLSSFPLLRSLPASVHEMLSEQLMLRCARGDVIFRQGEPSDTIFLVLRGLLGIHQSSLISVETQSVAYLSPGELCGELGVLCGSPRSATVTALADSELLVMPADDFLELLRQYGELGLEVSRQLARNVMSATHRIHGEQARLLLLAGRHLLPAGLALARELSTQSSRSVSLTSWLEPEALPARLGLPASVRSIQRHPDGFHLVIHRRQAETPAQVHAGLMLDALRQRYAWSILLLEPEAAAEIGDALLPDADGLILIDDDAEAGLSIPRLSFPPIRVGGRPESDVPLPEQVERAGDWTNVARAITARLGRRTEVAAYVPRLDSQGLSAESSIAATIELFARLFGGATLGEVQGTWLGDQDALINDQVCVVRSYTTDADFQQYLDQVIAHLERLKIDLHQDAMGLFAAGHWILI